MWLWLVITSLTMSQIIAKILSAEETDDARALLLSGDEHVLGEGLWLRMPTRNDCPQGPIG